MSQAPTQLHQPSWPEVFIGVGVLALAAFLAWGATGISSDAGYAGVGPNFLPWVVSAALAACGAWLLWEARTGGYRDREPPSGAERGDWPAFVWVSAGVLANAALITTLGFILSCALCYALAVRGLRVAEGKSGGDLRQTLKDAMVGLLIAAPVYWLFTKILAVNLPGLTSTGWL
jgi:putative tricarboxylic transport membrane protein